MINTANIPWFIIRSGIARKKIACISVVILIKSERAFELLVINGRGRIYLDF